VASLSTWPTIRSINFSPSRRRSKPIHELRKEVLRQKEAAIKAFDEKLAKLGYDGEHASKRSHHKDDADKKASD
jgi:hypothetical protein